MGELVQLDMETFQDLMAQTIKDQIEAMGFTRVDKANLAAPGMTDEEVDTLSPDEKLGRFMKAVLIGDVRTINEVSLANRALSEGTDSAGGYLVPEEFELDVIRVIETYGLIPKYARTHEMKYLTKSLAGQSSGVSVTWPGESTAGTSSQPVLEQPQLTLRKMMGLTAWSNEVLSDTQGLVVYLSDIFGEALAAEIDNQGFQGTGSSPAITGLTKITGSEVQTLVGETSFAAIDRANLIAGTRKLTQARRTGGRFVFHRDVIGVIEGMTDDNGQPLIRGMNEGEVTRLLGYPLEETEKMPSLADNDDAATVFGVFGNFKWVHYGRKAGIAVAIAKEGTIGSDNLFEKDMGGLRVTQRVDIHVYPEDAFVQFKTGAAS